MVRLQGVRRGQPITHFLIGISSAVDCSVKEFEKDVIEDGEKRVYG